MGRLYWEERPKSGALFTLVVYGRVSLCFPRFMLGPWRWSLEAWRVSKCKMLLNLKMVAKIDFEPKWRNLILVLTRAAKTKWKILEG